MTEMIEKVAKAIQAKCKERGFNECPAPLVHHVAGAAIEAMREPTQAMIDAGGVFAEHSVVAAWQEMIDAALRD